MKRLTLASVLLISTWVYSHAEMSLVPLPFVASPSDGARVDHAGISGAMHAEEAALSAAQVLQMGQARSIPQTATVVLTAAQLQWRDLPGAGKLAALRFSSPGASGIRLGITVLEIPLGTVFRFSSPAGGKTIAVSAEEISSVVENNLKAGESDEAARTYWSPDLGGSEVTLHVELAQSVKPQALRIYVARLSHITLDRPIPDAMPQRIKPAQ